MNPSTPDQSPHDRDDDLVHPSRGDGASEHPDMIWHRPDSARRRWRDAVPAPLRDLPDTVLVLAGIAALVGAALLVTGIGRTLLAAARWCADPAHLARPAAQIWHTVNDPIRQSLDSRSAGLPAGAGVLHSAWAAAGVVILLIALRRGASVGVQLGALAFGALTAAMVWDGTAGPGRPVAAGLAVLVWAVLAAAALTGPWIATRTTVINQALPAPAVTVAVPEPVPVPVHIDVAVPEPRIEAVVVDVQHLVVDRDGRRINPADPDRT